MARGAEGDPLLGNLRIRTLVVVGADQALRIDEQLGRRRLSRANAHLSVTSIARLQPVPAPELRAYASVTVWRSAFGGGRVDSAISTWSRLAESGLRMADPSRAPTPG